MDPRSGKMIGNWNKGFVMEILLKNPRWMNTQINTGNIKYYFEVPKKCFTFVTWNSKIMCI